MILHINTEMQKQDDTTHFECSHEENYMAKQTLMNVSKLAIVQDLKVKQLNGNSS